MDRRFDENSDFNEEAFLLKPGHIFFTKEGKAIRTVLGNSVSVCLWDKHSQYGGMNHFVYPKTKDSKKSTAKYGNIATLTLIKIMNEEGCKNENIIAQTFGGSFNEGGSGTNTGKDNILIARKILENKNIKIVSEDVGGSLGRKIIFDTRTGQVAVLKVHQIRDSDWF